MCTLIDLHDKSFIATENIVIYKVVKLSLNGYVSLYRRASIKFNTLMQADITTRIADRDHCRPTSTREFNAFNVSCSYPGYLREVVTGFHSFTTYEAAQEVTDGCLDRRIIKGYIPEGSECYKGYYNNIVSNKIIYLCAH